MGNTKVKKPADIDLAALAKAGGEEDDTSLPPVHLWNPPFCGDLDMRIASDGTWFYQGTPIGRHRLVKLFSRILRHDDDGKYYLVTPVEKVGLTVEDAPFLAVELHVENSGSEQILRFRTNVDDWATAGEQHPLRFETAPVSQGLKPYLHIRGRLEALVNRAVYYELAELGCEHEVDGEPWFGLWSAGVFFPMAAVEDLDQ